MLATFGPGMVPLLWLCGFSEKVGVGTFFLTLLLSLQEDYF